MRQDTIDKVKLAMQFIKDENIPAETACKRAGVTSTTFRKYRDTLGGERVGDKTLITPPVFKAVNLVKDKGLSVDEAARKTGASRSAIYHQINKDKPPSKKFRSIPKLTITDLPEPGEDLTPDVKNPNNMYIYLQSMKLVIGSPEELARFIKALQ